MIGAAMAVAVFAVAPGVAAQTTVANSGYTVGIAANGELYNGSTGVGFKRTSDGFDPIAPGTPRDSWGISTSSGAAYADGQDDGSRGLTTVLTSTGSTATAMSSTSLGLTVNQVYSFVAPNILQIATTVTNTSAAAVSALFQRDVDFDVASDFNNDMVSAFGTAPGNVVSTSNNGFENPSPAAAFFNACSAANCTRTGDVGGGIRLNLGSIAAGGSTVFNYYYGIGADSATLVSQASGLGVSYGLVDQFGGNSALLGVGPVSATPEPGTWAMMIMGFGIVGSALRRRKQVVRVSYAA